MDIVLQTIIAANLPLIFWLLESNGASDLIVDYLLTLNDGG